MEEAKLATPETAAAATWSVQQGGTGEQMRAAYGGPENVEGRLPLFSSWILVFGGSRFKRTRATLEGAGSMRHQGAGGWLF